MTLNPSGTYNDGQAASLARLTGEVASCRRCPRLVSYIEVVAREKRRAYKDWDYWGRPVPSFGDPLARLLIVGLAPGAHGANRTGRMFTGDSSGDWLFRALYRANFANQPHSIAADDGLQLIDAYITAVCHCAPPDNRPRRDEIAACRSFLWRELALLQTVRVIVCLGQLAFDNILRLMRDRGHGWPDLVTGADYTDGVRPRPRTRKPPFRHGGEYRWTLPDIGGGKNHGATELPVLIASYHPSRQNTNTGVLTEDMFDAIFARARALLSAEGPGQLPLFPTSVVSHSYNLPAAAKKNEP